MARKKKRYEVGYGKPPKSGQFRKGQSGNPKGRPKGSRDYYSIARGVLNSRMRVKIEGKVRWVSTMEAGLLRLREKAVHGDLRSLQLILEMGRELQARDDSKPPSETISRAEDDIIRDYIERNLKKDEGDE